MYQTVVKRNEHWLGNKNIEDEKGMNGYKTFLSGLDKNIKQRQEKHLKMIQWINYNKECEADFSIIKGQDYDNFQCSDDEDYIMDMQTVEGNDFYNKFKEMTGIHLLNIDNFINMTYISENKNDIEIIVNINGNNERFIIGV